MDNTTFVKLLTSVPPTRLRLLDLAADLMGPGGEVDLDAAAPLQYEIEVACGEAENHARATSRLAETLRWKAQPRRR